MNFDRNQLSLFHRSFAICLLFGALLASGCGGSGSGSGTSSSGTGASTGNGTGATTGGNTGNNTCTDATCRWVSGLSPSAQIGDSHKTVSTATDGQLVLDNSGQPVDFSVIAASVQLTEATTGPTSIMLDPGGTFVGGFQGDQLTAQFGVLVNTAVFDSVQGLKSDSNFCMGGNKAGAQCAVDADCDDQTCLTAKTCLCGTDARASQFFSCIATIEAVVQAGVHLVGTLEIQCKASQFGFAFLHFDFASNPSVALNKKDCPDDKKCDLKNVCIQPVRIADDNGANPTSCPSFDTATIFWKKCCLNLKVNAAKTIKKLSYKTMDEDPHSNLPTAQENEMFMAENDDSGTTNCVEVYCVDEFTHGKTTGKDISGGGATYNMNTTKAKVVVVGDSAAGIVTHELGHCFGLYHPDPNNPSDPDHGTIMSPTGRHDVEAMAQIHLDRCKNAHGTPLAKVDAPPIECCKMPD